MNDNDNTQALSGIRWRYNNNKMLMLQKYNKTLLHLPSFLFIAFNKNEGVKRDEISLSTGDRREFELLSSFKL